MSRHPETERNARIIALAQEGLTMAKIAEAIGVTRQVVAGVMHRARLKPSVVLPRRKLAPKVNPKRRATVEPSPADATTAWPGPRECRWIYGDPRPVPHWCGRRTPDVLTPYCEAHARRSVQNKPSSSEAAA